MDGNISRFLMLEIALNFVDPPAADLTKAAADTLRFLASRIEKGEFDSGNYPIEHSEGAVIGSIEIHHGRDDRF